MTLAPIPFLSLLFGGSIVAGALGALVGVGGGIIIVPLLTLLGVDVRLALGASLISVIATSSGAAAAYVQDRLTNLRVAIFLEMFTSTGALSGAVIQGFASTRVLSFVFAGILLLSGVGMLLRGPAAKGQVGKPDPWAKRLRMEGEFHDRATGRDVPYQVSHLALGSGLMFVAGNVSGLLGIGSGALKVPAMDLALGMPIKASSATSDFMIGVTAAASAGIYFARGQIQPAIAAPVALGVLLGSLVGTRLLGRLKSGWVRGVFIAVLCAMAAQMVLHGLFAGSA
ncbi:MAG: sulfite exporter TauE/SafE family protein [Deltaproteobacteria bacterium]